MKITIRVCNENPSLDIRTAALSCKGKVAGSKNFSKADWIKWLIAEHTPIETIQLAITFEEMEKSVIAQLVRHTDKHPRHFVQSSRPDMNGGKPRDPNALIMYTAFYNPHALILMMRKRLCTSSEKRTRDAACLLKFKLMNSENPLLQAIGECCVPNCVYRAGCSENWAYCGYDKQILNSISITARYAVYNEHFNYMMQK